MDPREMKKMEGMNRYKRGQFLENLYLYLYLLSGLTCSVLCSVTLCLPYLSSLVLLHISSLIQVLLSTKFLFIIGNLIIFFLVVNSRILSSDSSSTCVLFYEEYIQIPSPEVNESKILEKHVGGNSDMAWEEEEDRDGGNEQSMMIPSSDDELNKRADDFIARVNRQRRLELSLLDNASY